MLTTTAGQVLINAALPPGLRDWSRTLDKKGVAQLFDDLARQHPEAYRETAKRLADVARDVAYGTGGFSFGLSHLRTPPAAELVRAKIRQAVQQIQARRDLDPAAQGRAIVQLLQTQSKPLEAAVLAASQAENNPLAHQVRNVGRGNASSLKSLRAGDLLYEDQNGDPIPVPVLSSYAEGLRPVEYWAAGFGARRGVWNTKHCLASQTLVRMADFSVRAIRDIQAGDYVLGSDREGRHFPVRVVRRYDNGPRECHRFEFRVGSSPRMLIIEATDDHKILAEVRAGRPGSAHAYRAVYTPTLLPLGSAKFRRDCTKNDFVACPSRGSYPRPDQRHEPLALLYGLLIGDGATRTGWTFSCADPQLVEDITDYLATLDFSLTPPKTGYTWFLASRRRWPFARTGKYITGTGNPHLQRLTQLGVRCLAHDKTIASEVWTWDQPSVAALIAGIFSTDGSVSLRASGPRLGLCMTAKPVITTIKELLEVRFGIWSGRIGHVPLGTKENMRHEQWAFTVSHQECVTRFAQEIPLVGCKREQMAAGIATSRRDASNASFGCKLIRKTTLGQVDTCDLEVDHPEHMFVLANGLIVSNSTQEAGYLAKQLNQITHRLVVTADDTDDDEDGDGRTHEPAAVRGLPVAVDDPDNAGALLARTTGVYPRNTVLTPAILDALRRQGHSRILVRSPAVGGPAAGGVAARDVGVRERGGLPPRGDFVGLAAAQAIAEKLTQGQLSSKHGGGVAGASRAVSGFKYVDALVQVPREFPGGAAHAQQGGRVTAVTPAPQGGHQVTIAGATHHVPAGQTVTVRPGDAVEAGDVLSDGLPSPAQIVRHKGIGAGRQHFLTAFRDAYAGAGMQAHRRNIELLARGLIDHVRLTDEWAGHLPDDIVPYSAVEHAWTPRPGARALAPESAVGRYLERPVLHHTIGTRIQPSHLADLRHFGVHEVLVHDDPPPFVPEMVRGMGNLLHDPDWLTRHLGSNLQKGLLEAVHRGRTSDSSGTSYVPAAADRRTFGRHGLTRGWTPRDGDGDGHVLDGTPHERPQAKAAAAAGPDAGALAGWAEDGADD